jgi:NTE family protein
MADQVVIRTGRIVEALRATIEAPFRFAPQHTDGRRLVDVAPADPLPVTVASDAQSVIAVAFRSPMPSCIDRAWL